MRVVARACATQARASQADARARAWRNARGAARVEVTNALARTRQRATTTTHAATTQTKAWTTSQQCEVGDVVAYDRKGGKKLGVVVAEDGKANVRARELAHKGNALGEDCAVKIAKKAIEMNFGAMSDGEARAIGEHAAKMARDEEAVRSAREVIYEFANEGEIINAEYVSDVIFGDVTNKNVYAAHCMLNSTLGNVYFKTKGKDEYEPRTAAQIDALAKKADAEARAGALESAFVDEIRAAIAAPKGAKPEASTLWRYEEEDNGARERRFEALQAYALGEKFYSPGEKAMADDLLGKLGFSRTPESALQTLIASGAWSAHENLSIRRYDVPVEFPEHARDACAAVLAKDPVDPDANTRLDLTHLKVFAVDDAATVEVDDGLSVEALGDDVTRVWVHIADPTRWIECDSALDVVARRRATTLYYPTEIVPMFPLELASGPMSLGGDRCAAMTVRADVAADGSVLDFAITPSYVRLDRRWTYDDVDSELVSKTCDANLRLLYTVAQARYELRAEAGAVTISLPESSLDVKGVNARGEGDEDSITLTMGKVQTDAPSRMLVSEMMVLVGDVVGAYGARENIPLPYRGQNQPRLMTDDEWDRIPEGICQDIAMRMCMSPSTSGATPRPHAGLGLDAYVQFTSPIRRYTDILAHYQLKAHLRGERPLPFADVQTLERVIEDVGASVGAATRSQRETTKYWSQVYFQRQPADARWRATVVKFIRGDDLVSVIFEDLAFEAVLKLDRGAILGETLIVRFLDADPHAGIINFRVDKSASASASA